MTYKEIAELYEAAPFEPFKLVMPNGSGVEVDHPEFMAFSRDHRTLHFYPRRGGVWHIDIKLITRAEVPASNSSKRPKAK